MAITIRDILLTLSVRYQGEWTRIYDAIKAKEELKAEEIHDAYQKTKANFLTLSDSEYPECFKNQCNPPFLLYYYGNKDFLKLKYRLAVIGTRSPTLYQNDTVFSLIQDLEKKFSDKVGIVSGMAKGIDQIAMMAAMERGAPILSVIGSGIDNPYPKENQKIYDYCCSQKGLVLSEYPLSTEAKPENFLFRNRLLASLGNALFVGGGRNRSGSASSVRYALDQNKDVLALPCNITGDDLTNSLISDGARSVLGVHDLADALFDCCGKDAAIYKE
jgi:DNA processing protein